ncbi:MAG TPA: PAS domain S-box protein [Cyclobacteriaceae bacterium]
MKNRKRTSIYFLSTLLLFFISNFTYAQQNTIDSLSRILEKLPQDSNRVNTLNDLSLAQSFICTNKIYKPANEALALSKKIGFKKGEAQANEYLAYYYYHLGNSTQALEYLWKSLALYEETKNTFEIANSYNKIGLIYQSQNEAEAVIYFKKALNLWTHSNNKSGIGMALENIANEYKKEQKDSIALRYYGQSLALAKSENEPQRIGSLLNAIGSIYLKKKEYKKSIALQDTALIVALSLNSQILQSRIYSDLSMVYEELKDYNKSLHFAEKALTSALKINSKQEIRNGYCAAFKAYKGLKNYQKAFEFQSLYISLNDSLTSSENKKAFASLKHKSNTEKSKLQTQIVDQLHDTRIERTKINIFLLALVILLVLLILIINKQQLAKIKRRLFEKQHLKLVNEQTLREESEKKYKTVVESELLSLVIAKEDNFVYANKTILKKFGYQYFAEVKDKSVISHATKETKREIYNRLTKIRNGDCVPPSFIGHFIDKNQKLRSFEVQTCCLQLNGEYCQMYQLVDITERLTAESSLNEMETLFRLAQSFSNIGSWRWDTSGNLLWSETTYKIFGINPESNQIDEARFLEYIHPEDRKNVLSKAKDCFEKKEIFKIEHRIQTESGAIRWIQLTGDVLKNDSRQTTMFGIARDITESKSITQELKANKEKYKLLAESGNDIIGLYDINGIIQYVSPALSTVLGYTPEDVIGKKLIIPSTDQKIFRSLFQQAIENPKSSFTARIRVKRNASDKEYCWFQKNLKAILDNDNNVIAIRWMMHDISKEIAYEKMVHQSNIDLIDSVEQYKTLNEKLNTTLRELEVQSLKTTFTNQKLIESQNSLQRTYYDLKLKTDALNKISITTSFDKDGCITSVNERFTEVVGYSSAEMIGKTYQQLQPEFNNAETGSSELFKILWDTLQEPKEWSGEMCIQTKSGKTVWLLKNIIPIWNDGHFTGYFSFSYDITLQKKREDEIIQAKLLAEEASAIKEDFLSVMSHEIRTPLNSVIGLSNLLLKRSPREDQLEIVKTLKHSGDNLVLLINDILDYNKIRAGKIELEETVFSPVELLQQLQASYQLIASEKGLDFLITIDTSIPDFVIGDLSRLNQILHNLINNALKFTRKGHVRIQTSLKSISEEGNSGTLLFAIGDSGIGIPKEKLDVIFTAFNQSEKYISREFGGTGLGLSIVKNLVNLFKGEIDVISEVNKGSEFLISIPFKIHTDTTPIIPKHIAGNNSIESVINGYRILYVEDVESNQLLVKSFLEDCGADCSVASNGNIALQHTSNKIFDVILMDLQMPGLNGYEVTDAIRKQPNGKNQDTAIVAFTAEAYSQNLRLKTEAHAFQDVITKPFQFDNLINKISKVCPTPRPEENFLTLDFYEEAFENNQQKLREIKRIIINDIRKTEANINKYSTLRDLNGLKTEIHKLSPIAKNIRCYSLMNLLEEYRIHETYSHTIVGLNTELSIFLKRVKCEIKDFNY